MPQAASDCLFCRIVAGQIPAHRVHEDNTYLAFRDINPQAPTHVLIIPKTHIATLNDAEEDDNALLGGMLTLAARIARDEGCAEDGYRVVLNCNRSAGQSVFHIHAHVLGGRSLTWPPG